MLSTLLEIATLWSSSPPSEADTREAVAELQKKMALLGLPVGTIDGVPGPITRGCWALLRFRRDRGQLGWWETPGTLRRSSVEHLVSTARRYGVDRVSIMVNDVMDTLERDWRLRVDEAKLGELLIALDEAGIATGLTPWVTPDEDFTLAMLDDIGDLCAEYPVTEIHWDAESPWSKMQPSRGYSVAQCCAEIARWRMTADVERMVCVGYVYAGADTWELLRVCDAGLPMAYSQWQHGREQYKPDDVQQWAVDRWGPRLDGRDMVMGLGAYKWSESAPGWYPTAEQNLLAMVGAAVIETGCKEFYVWDAWHVRAHNDIGRAYRMLGDTRASLGALFNELDRKTR